MKEKNDGGYIYSYNAERADTEGMETEEIKKELSTRRTLHADVNQFAESEEVNTQPNNSISNPDEKVKGDSKISYSFASDEAEDAPKMPNGEAMPTSNDMRISPFESAERMLRGGVQWSEVQKQTKLTMRQIALQMQANGADAADVRALTGLYQDEIGTWHFDEGWLEKNVPDLATNRDAQLAAAKSAFDPSRAGIEPAELSRAYRTLKNIGEGARKIIQPSAKEFAGDYAVTAARNAIDLVMREKVPTVDAVLRTGAKLLDMAKAMQKKYAASTILKRTGYAFEDGEWKADQRAMLDMINAAGNEKILR